MIITIKHIHDFYCAKGGRAFFKRQGWDWSDFLKDGIEAEKLLATGDAMAIELVEFAKNGG